MGYSSKELLELLNLDHLQSLLKESDDGHKNHPFLVFLTDNKIETGPNEMEIDLLISLYKATGGLLKGQRKRHILKVCSHITVGKKVSINFTEKTIMAKIKRASPSPKLKMMNKIKKQFEQFVDSQIHLLSGVTLNEGLAIYIKWCKKHQRVQQIKDLQTFGTISRLYFGDECVERKESGNK